MNYNKKKRNEKKKKSIIEWSKIKKKTPNTEKKNNCNLCTEEKKIS